MFTGPLWLSLQAKAKLNCSGLACLLLSLLGFILCFAGPAPVCALQSGAAWGSELLQQRIDAQHEALHTGDPVAIEEATKRLTAYALFKMAGLRSREAAIPQAILLYRESLALETSEEVQAALAQLLSAPAASNDATADAASDPSAAHLVQAHLSAAQQKDISTQQQLLHQILGTSFQDWGTLKARQHQYAEALGYFHQAEDWNAASPGLMRDIGIAAFRANDFAESVRAFDLALLVTPDDHQSRLLMATALFSLDRFADAARAFDAVAAEATRDPRTAYAYAFSLARTNQQDKANTVLDQLTAQAMAPEALALVCHVYDMTENYEHSAKCFQQLSQQNPSFPHAHLGAGSALIHLDRPSDAIKELQAELLLNAQDVDAQYYLAFAYLQVSRKEEALKLLRMVVEEKPDYVEAQYQLGKMLFEDGATDEAIQHLEIAAASDTTHDYLHYQLQAAYRKAGRTAEADRELSIYKSIKAHHREVPGVHSVQTP